MINEAKFRQLMKNKETKESFDEFIGELETDTVWNLYEVLPKEERLIEYDEIASIYSEEIFDALMQAIHNALSRRGWE